MALPPPPVPPLALPPAPPLALPPAPPVPPVPVPPAAVPPVAVPAVPKLPANEDVPLNEKVPPVLEPELLEPAVEVPLLPNTAPVPAVLASEPPVASVPAVPSPSGSGFSFSPVAQANNATPSSGHTCVHFIMDLHLSMSAAGSGRDLFSYCPKYAPPF